jgi:arylsulfatase A-like enzyme/disulfide bond formation protein DsbB
MNTMRIPFVRGAIFGILLLAIEEAANLATDQPPLSLDELMQIALWYAASMALLGLILAPLKDPFAHLLGLIGTTGGFMAGGKIAEELWWRDFSQWEANAVGYASGAALAAFGLWASLALTRTNARMRMALAAAGLCFLPAFRAMNINAYGSPLSPEALTADGVLLAVTVVFVLLAVRFEPLVSLRPNRSLAALLVGIGVAIGAARMATAQSLPPPAADAPDRPDVLLVIIDTLRADHVGVYGHSVDTTPNLDGFAANGLRYAHAGSPASWTLPSFGAFATGRYPNGHGAGLNNGDKNTQSALDPDVPTLAEQMAERGYRTGAIVTNPYLKQSFGIARGFDSYSDALGLAHMPMFVQPLRMLTIPVMGGRYFYRPADIMVSEAIEWWEAMEGGPRFLMLHLMDPHDPYNPPSKHRDAIGSPHGMAVLNQYDQEIHFTDAELGRLLDRVGPNVLTVVTSDHGDTFGEHEDPYPQDHWPFTRHGHTLYQELTHVPLMVRGPGVEPGVVERPVRAFDVVPTILAVAGAESLPTDGTVLTEVVGSPESDERAVGAQAMRFGSEKRSARLGPWKLIETRWGDELYNLSTDPSELRNLSTEHPEEASRLRMHLPDHRDATTTQTIDAETAKQLEALGYMQD